jgi:hypothetical protein
LQFFFVRFLFERFAALGFYRFPYIKKARLSYFPRGWKVKTPERWRVSEVLFLGLRNKKCLQISLEAFILIFN